MALSKNFIMITLGVLSVALLLTAVLTLAFRIDDARFLLGSGPVWTALLYLLAALFWFLLYRFLRILCERLLTGTEASLTKGRLVRGFGFLLAFCFQLLIVFFARSAYKWDALYVIGAAGSLLRDGTITDPGILHYISIYPNQNAFLFLTAGLLRLSRLFGISAVNTHYLTDVFTVLCLDLGLLFTYLLMTPSFDGENGSSGLQSKKKEAKATADFLFLLCCPFLYLCVSYYYTISLSLPFSMGALYVLKRAMRLSNEDRAGYKQAVFLLFGGLLLGASYLIRPTAILFVIAFVLVWLLFAGKKGKILLALFAFVLTILIGRPGLDRFVGIDTHDTAFPASHWVMMALTAPGTHHAEDEEYTNSFATAEEKKEAVKARMKEKLKAMDAKDILSLSKDKVEIVFADGSHGYLTYRSDSAETGGVYERVYGTHRDVFAVLLQGYQLLTWLMLILLCFRKLSALRKGEAVDEDAVFVLYLFFGAFCFYLIWEVAGNYYLPFMFVFLQGVCMGLEEADRLLNERGIAKGFERTAALFGILAMTVFAFTHRMALLAEEFRYEHPVSSQIVGFKEIPVTDGEILRQHILVKEGINHLVLQWRNPDGGKNGSVYELRLSANGEVLFTERIEAGDAYQGLGDYRFPDLKVPGKEAVLEIEKLEGKADENLSFVICEVPGFSPYYGGELVVEQGGKERIADGASLLFMVGDVRQETYTRPKRLAAGLCALSFAFLIMGFCSTIVGVRSGGPDTDRKNEQITGEEP